MSASEEVEIFEEEEAMPAEEISVDTADTKEVEVLRQTEVGSLEMVYIMFSFYRK